LGVSPWHLWRTTQAGPFLATLWKPFSLLHHPLPKTTSHAKSNNGHSRSSPEDRQGDVQEQTSFEERNCCCARYGSKAPMRNRKSVTSVPLLVTNTGLDYWAALPSSSFKLWATLLVPGTPGLSEQLRHCHVDYAQVLCEPEKVLKQPGGHRRELCAAPRARIKQQRQAGQRLEACHRCSCIPDNQRLRHFLRMLERAAA
jgi:hypothetical protein